MMATMWCYKDINGKRNNSNISNIYNTVLYTVPNS